MTTVFSKHLIHRERCLFTGCGRNIWTSPYQISPANRLIINPWYRRTLFVSDTDCSTRAVSDAPFLRSPSNAHRIAFAIASYGNGQTCPSSKWPAEELAGSPAVRRTSKSKRPRTRKCRRRPDSMNIREDLVRGIKLAQRATKVHCHPGVPTTTAMSMTRSIPIGVCRRSFRNKNSEYY